MSRVDQVARLAEQLERAILSGEFATGDDLPAERVISQEQGVSRSVVREALGRLASLGLVRSIHGSGTRVEAPSSRQVTLGYQRLLNRKDMRMEHLAAVRLPLETTIAALAAEHHNTADLQRLQDAQKVLGNPRRSLEAHVAADLEFHAALAAASGNPLFLVVLTPIQELLMASRRHTLGEYGVDLAYRHHAKILEAVESRNPTEAAEAMRQHIEVNLQHLQQAVPPTRAAAAGPTSTPSAGPEHRASERPEKSRKRERR